MTKSSVHAILGELHRLLATYSAADFLEASRYVGSSAVLRLALRTLAREAEPGTSESSRQRPRLGAAAGKSRRRVLAAVGQREQLLNVIRHSAFFGSTRSLLAYVKNLGLRLPSSPKESRERLARKLVRLIEELPEPKRSDVISDLLRGRNSQTQGWIDVIKGR